MSEEPMPPMEDGGEVSRQLVQLAAKLQTEVEKIAQLGDALQTRDVIGQAKGILMERYQLTEPQAFRFLMTESNQTHVKLRDVAASLARTGDFDRPEGWSNVMKEVMSNERSQRDAALGEAKDLLMKRYNLDEQGAFDFLVEMSLEMNVNVIEVAMHLLRAEN